MAKLTRDELVEQLVELFKDFYGEQPKQSWLDLQSDYELEWAIAELELKFKE